MTVGRGVLADSHPLLQHTFQNWDPPKAVSFSTGFGYRGIYRIEEDQGKMRQYFCS